MSSKLPPKGQLRTVEWGGPVGKQLGKQLKAAAKAKSAEDALSKLSVSRDDRYLHQMLRASWTFRSEKDRQKVLGLLLGWWENMAGLLPKTLLMSQRVVLIKTIVMILRRGEIQPLLDEWTVAEGSPADDGAYEGGEDESGAEAERRYQRRLLRLAGWASEPTPKMPGAVQQFWTRYISLLMRTCSWAYVDIERDSAMIASEWTLYILGVGYMWLDWVRRDIMNGIWAQGSQSGSAEPLTGSGGGEEPDESMAPLAKLLEKCHEGMADALEMSSVGNVEMSQRRFARGYLRLRGLMRVVQPKLPAPTVSDSQHAAFSRFLSSGRQSYMLIACMLEHSRMHVCVIGGYSGDGNSSGGAGNGSGPGDDAASATGGGGPSSAPPSFDARVLPAYSHFVSAVASAMFCEEMLSWPDVLRRSSSALVADVGVLAMFLRILFPKTNIYDTQAVRRALDTLGEWFSAHAQFAGRITSKRFCFRFFLDAIKILLGSEVVMVLCPTLLFLYNHISTFAGKFRERLWQFLLDPDVFFRLALHWSRDVRFVFIRLIVYRPMRLPAEYRLMPDAGKSERDIDKEAATAVGRLMSSITSETRSLRAGAASIPGAPSDLRSSAPLSRQAPSPDVAPRRAGTPPPIKAAASSPDLTRTPPPVPSRPRKSSEASDAADVDCDAEIDVPTKSDSKRPAKSKLSTSMSGADLQGSPLKGSKGKKKNSKKNTKPRAGSLVPGALDVSDVEDAADIGPPVPADQRVYCSATTSEYTVVTREYRTWKAKNKDADPVEYPGLSSLSAIGQIQSYNVVQ